MTAFEELRPHHYRVILADPPWRFKTWDKREAVIKRGNKYRAKDIPHYDTMTHDKICALPVHELAAEDCVLFLWMSWPQLEDAIEVIQEWGFRYKTAAFVWIKSRNQSDLFSSNDVMGLGYWTRANSEVCLLATRGRPKRINADVRQVIVEPRREHSRKPDCVHGRIERLVEGPYCELFARQRRSGWDVWGAEVDRFSEAV